MSQAVCTPDGSARLAYFPFEGDNAIMANSVSDVPGAVYNFLSRDVGQLVGADGGLVVFAVQRGLGPTITNPEQLLALRMDAKTHKVAMLTVHLALTLALAR